jgi:protein-tyrosine phosphatase
VVDPPDGPFIRLYQRAIAPLPEYERYRCSAPATRLLFGRTFDASTKKMPSLVSNCYWVSEGFLAGATFDSWSESEAMLNLEELNRVGVSVIVSLAARDEFLMDSSQRRRLQEEVEGVFTHYIFPLQDGEVPTRARVREILDAIDTELSRNRRVYVHCCGGRGRTGTIVGCWLARHGCGTGQEVLDAITALRRAAFLDGSSPETEEQRSLVTNWKWNE